MAKKIPFENIPIDQVEDIKKLTLMASHVYDPVRHQMI